jgi:peptidylprolyl isomerase
MDSRVKILIGFAAVLAVAVGAVLIGRGGGDSGDDSSTTAAATEKPKVEVPDAPPPKKLVVEDLEPGDGEAAKAGDQISVQYVGVDYETGKEFDSSYDRGQPFDLQLGGGSVIPGWDQGIVGMKVGGRRKLTIPPDLAYGKQGQPPAIGPNATLVFVIDLVSVG